MPANVVLGSFVKPVSTRPSTIPATLKNSLDCSIDKINEQAVGESTKLAANALASVKIHGWAANVDRGTLPQEVHVEIDGPGKLYAAAILGDSRPDVGTHFKNPLLNGSGWNAFADLSTLKSGSYKLRVVTVTGGIGAVCEARRVIVLTDK